MFLYVSLSSKNPKARDSFDAKRARFSSNDVRDVRASFEERSVCLSFVEIAFVEREAF